MTAKLYVRTQIYRQNHSHPLGILKYHAVLSPISDLPDKPDKTCPHFIQSEIDFVIMLNVELN